MIPHNADEGEMEATKLQQDEECPHTHVDHGRMRFVRGAPPPTLQIGYCLDCGFHVWRRITVSDWTIKPQRAA